MKPVKFMISGVLFFVLVGPPVGGVVFLLGIASIGPAEGFARFLPLALLYGYVGGLLPALMAGGFCCATMLAASRYLPKWANASQPIVRFALVAAVAAAFILLYLLAPAVRQARWAVPCISPGAPDSIPGLRFIRRLAAGAKA